MTKLSSDRYQVWFPGKLVWELWFINQKKGTAKLVDSAEKADELRFKIGGGMRVLALPAAELSTVTFFSSALEEKKLIKGAHQYLSRQNIQCDMTGYGIQPVSGYPPKTLTRIDAPNSDLEHQYPTRLQPDLVVPSASVLPMHRRSIAFWTELGRPVAAFSKKGLTAWYHGAKDSELTDWAELSDKLYAAVDGFKEDRVVESVAAVHQWIPKIPYIIEANLDKEIIKKGDRPAPTNLRSTIGMRPYQIEVIKNRKVERKKSVARTFAACSVALLMVGLAIALFYFSDQQMNDQRAELEQLTEELDSVRDSKDRWNEVAMAVDRDQSLLETWRSLVTTPGARYVTISRMAMAQKGIALYCQAYTREDAENFIDQISKNPNLETYFWDYTDPEIRADGTALFELKGLRAIQ